MKVSLAYQDKKKTFPLILDPIPIDANYWYIEKPFEMRFLENGILKTIHIKEGYKTNFASIPQWAWSFIGHPCQEYREAALIHDWLYGEKIYQRLINDKIFLLGMKALGVMKWKRYAMYQAVRIGGWLGYKDNKNIYINILEHQKGRR